MNKASVLLLERNANVISMIRSCLADEAELHVTNTVDLAVRIAERRPISVAVLDATMAGLSSSDTVARLRAVRPDLRIVFLTDAPFDLDRRLAQAGFVLRKPITPERFTDTVRNALRLQSMSAGVQRMRSSSGTFTAVRPHADAPAAPPAPPAAPPPATAPQNVVPPAGEARRTVTESGEIPVDVAREASGEDARDKGEPTRRPTPAPFQRVR